jgi:hypothetical protein
MDGACGLVLTARASIERLTSKRIQDRERKEKYTLTVISLNVGSDGLRNAMSCTSISPIFSIVSAAFRSSLAASPR